MAEPCTKMCAVGDRSDEVLVLVIHPLAMTLMGNLSKTKEIHEKR